MKPTVASDIPPPGVQVEEEVVSRAAESSFAFADSACGQLIFNCLSLNPAQKQGFSSFFFSFPKTKTVLGFDFSLSCAKRITFASLNVSWAPRLSQGTKPRAFKEVRFGDVNGNPSWHYLSRVSDPCVVLSQCPDVSVGFSALVVPGSHLQMETRAVETNTGGSPCYGSVEVRLDGLSEEQGDQLLAPG